LSAALPSIFEHDARVCLTIDCDPTQIPAFTLSLASESSERIVAGPRLDHAIEAIVKLSDDQSVVLDETGDIVAEQSNT
jgi:hypothetical protein